MTKIAALLDLYYNVKKEIDRNNPEGRTAMFIESAKLTFRIAHAASLKDKRQVRRSLIDKVRHKFNASIAEVDTQDAHQLLTVGIAVVSSDVAHAEKSLDEIVRFMEDAAEQLGAELLANAELEQADNFTQDELSEALRAIESTIGKCEKAYIKLTEGTSHHTLMKRRLAAFNISKMLIERENKGVFISRP